MPGLVAAFVAALAVTVAACDTVAPELVTLPVEEATFTFAVRGDTVGTQPFVLVSAEQVDLAGSLEGFDKNEILASEVVAVELERLEPPLARLDAILDAAALELTTDDLPPVVVGAAETLPSAFRAELVPADRDVSAYLRAPSFGGRLRLDPATLEDDRYVFEVTVRLQIQVEGI